MVRTKKILIKKARLFTNDFNQQVIRITFPYSTKNLSEIHTIEGRKWNANKKYWTVPLSLENAFKLRDLKYSFGPNLKEWSNAEYKHKNNPIKKIKGLKGTLFPYQFEGVSFLENKKGRALIADEMGLGKTIQALAWLQLHPENRPAIITCPASVKLNWMQEALTWMNVPKVQIISGTKTYIKLIGDIFIINFKILANKQEGAFTMKGAPWYLANGKRKMIDISHTGWVDFLIDLNPKVVIIDEIHFIKNNTAGRTRGIKRLCKNVPYIIGLSGTPIESRPLEIFNVIKLIDSSIFPVEWTFKHRYCGAKHNGFGWDFKGSSNTKELYDILTERVMIRRKKKDELKDLPDKLYSFVPIEIDNRKEYKAAEDDFIHLISDDTEKINHLAQIEILKQLAVKGKLKEMIKWIENFLESGEKLVVFGVHKFVIDAIMSHFGKNAVKIDGSVNIKKRQEAINTFQTDKKIKLFVGNIKAAGVGITLTAASNVAFMEYPWTPSDISQSADRVHRIGQLFLVNIHFLMGINTIEEKIAKMLNEKQKVVNSVLDGKDTIDGNILIDLVNSFKFK